MAEQTEDSAVKTKMLVVDDKANIRLMLEEAFQDQGFSVTTASSGEEAIECLEKCPFDIVITDLSMPGKNGIEVLKAAKAIYPDTSVILISAYGTIETAVEAMRLGAMDFITKPFQIAELERKVQKITRRLQQPPPPPFTTWLHPSVQFMVGTSNHTNQLMRMITKIAPGKSSVLITGPSGVGKELVARAIHEASPRRDRPFVALNCAALASGVLESELFGHEKGSFTGASNLRIGRFEKAHTGTLFLDEVGEIDPLIQTKLLRVLQESEIERVGGHAPQKVDVRIVAATNRNLEEAIAEGSFREDFYYRLNVFSINVEPLRKRTDDIPSLIEHFLRKFSIELGKDVTEIDDDVLNCFLNYPWPGNVRELENVLERAVVLSEGDSITLDDLPTQLLQHNNTPSSFQSDAETLTDRTESLERELIKEALDRFKWNKTKTSEHLGIKRTTLQYKVKKYGLD